MDWFAVQGTLRSSPGPQFEIINSLALSFLYGPALTSADDYRKNHHFDYEDPCRQHKLSRPFFLVYPLLGLEGGGCCRKCLAEQDKKAPTSGQRTGRGRPWAGQRTWDTGDPREPLGTAVLTRAGRGTKPRQPGTDLENGGQIQTALPRLGGPNGPRIAAHRRPRGTRSPTGCDETQGP